MSPFSRHLHIVFAQDENGERTKGKITGLSGTSLQIMTGGAGLQLSLRF